MNTYKDFPEQPPVGYGFIYFLRSPSGKGYVGQTIRSVKQRLYCHCHTSRGHSLLKAIVKYGLDNFFVDVLGQYPIADLDNEEMKAIREFNTLAPYGYNLTKGGQGLGYITKSGYQMSENEWRIARALDARKPTIPWVEGYNTKS